MDWKLVLVLVVGITYSQKSLDKAFSPNREYVYEYEAQLVTGIPEGSKLYSGLKVKSDVKFQFKTASRVTMQMGNIYLYKLNDIVEGEDPTREQLSTYKEVTGPEARWMTNYLMKPVLFKYLKGHVMEITGEKDEMVWSMNAKRGLLSLFEMNFEERMSVGMRERWAHDRGSRQNPSYIYTVMEPSVVGDCETTYNVETDVPNEGENYMYLTKVRNYKKCLERPVYARSIFNSMTCAECERDRTEPFKSASQTRYIMKGDKRRFIIQSAIGESQHIFTPYSPQGGSVATYINQTLVLINQQDVQTAIPSPQNPQIFSRGVQADVYNVNEKSPQPLTVRPSPITGPVPSRTPAESKQLILKYLEMVFTFSKDDVQEMTTSITLLLTDELRTASPEVLRSVMELYKSHTNPSTNSEKFYKRKIFLDLLPMTGTPAAMEVLAECIKKSHVNPTEAAMILNVIAVTAYPDINVAKYILEIVRDQYVKTTEPIRRSAYMSLGAVANRIMLEKDTLTRQLQEKERQILHIESRVNRKHILDQLKSRLVYVQDQMEQTASIFSKLKTEIMKEVRGLFTTEKTDDIVMALKTIGNTGFPEFIPDSKSIVLDKSKPQIMRAQAIYSMRKMTAYAPETIRSILLPVFFNHQEPEEVRIASYILVAGTKPPRYVWEMIAQSLHTEYNPHVGTFVYTHLEQISNSTHPCLMSWARNATFALRFAKRFSPNFHYSQFIHLSGYNDKFKLGGALEMGYVSSPEGFIPRGGAVHANVQILGQSINVMEVGFNTEGLQTLVSRLVGPASKFASGRSASDVLGMTSSTEESAEMSGETSQQAKPAAASPVKKTQEKLRVAPRTSPHPKGHVYFKLFNNEIRYFDLDEWIINSVLEKGNLGLFKGSSTTGMSIDLYKSAMVMDGQYSWFTELGFPIHFKIKGSTTFKIFGSWDMKLAASGVGTNHEIRVDLKPSMAVQMRGVVETDFYYIRSGAGVVSEIQSGSPLSFSALYDTTTGKVVTKMNFKNMREKLMHAEMVPVFFVEKYFLDTTKPPAIDMKYIEAMNGAQTYPVNYEWGKHEVGLTFGFKGQCVSRDFLAWLPYYPFLGRNTFYMTVKPGINPPEYGEFQFKHTTAPSGWARSSSEIGQPAVVRSAESQESGQTDSSGTGMLSGFMSYIWGEPESQPSPKYSGTEKVQSSSQNSAESESSSQYSAESGEQRTSEEQWKYGFTVKFVGVGSKPERWFMMNGLIKTHPDENRCLFDFKYTRTPFPEKENSPYTLDVTGSLVYPEMTIEPSSIMNPSYQRKINWLIQRYIMRHGEEESLEKVLVEQPKQIEPAALDKTLSPYSSRREMNNLIEDLISDGKFSAEPSSQELIALIQHQKHVTQRLRQLQRQRHNVLNASFRLQQINNLVDHLCVMDEKIPKLMTGPQSPWIDALLKTVVLRQQRNLECLQKIAKMIRGNVNSPQKEDLRSKVRKFEQSILNVLEKQAESEESMAQYGKTRSHVPAVMMDLRRKQAKALQAIANPAKTVSMSELWQLARKTGELIESVGPMELESPERKPLQLLCVLIQHQQVLEGLTQFRIHARTQQMLAELIGESKEPKASQGLRRLARKMEEQCRAISLVSLMKQDAMTVRLMRSGTLPHINIQVIKDIHGLRIRQIKLAVLLSESPKLENDQANNALNKLQEISSKLAEKSEDLRHYSPVVQNIKSVCDVQIQLLNRVRDMLHDKLTPSLARKIQNTKLITLDIEAKVFKAIRQSAMTSIPLSGYSISKILAHVKMDQNTIESLQKRPNLNMNEFEHVLDISSEIIHNLKHMVDVVSRWPSFMKQSHVLKEVKEAVRTQERVLKAAKIKAEASMSSQRGHWESSINRQHRELDELKIKIDTLVRVSPREATHWITSQHQSREQSSQISSIQEQSAGQSSEEDSSEVSAQQPESRESREQRVNIPSAVRQFITEIKQKLSETSESSTNPEKQQRMVIAIKESVQLAKEAVAAVSAHPWIRIPERELRRLKDIVHSLQQKIALDVPAMTRLRPRLDSEIRVMKATLDTVMRSGWTSMPSHETAESQESMESESSLQDPLRNQGSTDSIILNMDFKFGYSGLPSKMIRIEGTIEKSMAQLQWEAQQMSPFKDDLVQMYLAEKGEATSMARHAYRKLKRELNIFRHYHFKVQYTKTDFDEYYRMILWRVQEFIKVAFYSHAEFKMPHVTTNTIEVMFDVKRNNRQIDFTLMTPTETNQFFGINFPYVAWLRMFYTPPSEMPVAAPMLSALTRMPGMCEMNHGSIRTIDQHVFELPPMGSCDVILAMDCSASARFMVKARKPTESSSHWIISMVVNSRVVEVESGTSPRVTVDGKAHALEPTSPVVIHSKANPGQVWAEVTRKGQDIQVTVPWEGLHMFVSSAYVKLQVTPHYYSKICGLCGNYDGIPVNDMEGPEKMLHRSPSCFVTKYITSNAQCNATHIKEQCSKEQPASPDVCKPVQKTTVKTRQYKGKSQVCFSVDPVLECKPGCTEIKPRGKSVPMKCLEQTSKHAQTLLSQSHHRPLPEIRSMSVPPEDQYSQSINEPYSCSKN